MTLLRPSTACLAGLAMWLFTALAPAAAAPPEPQPGTYVRGGDSGTLTITRDAQGRLRFAIESMGGNCHSCTLDGSLEGTKGQSTDGPDVRCDIGFEPVRNGIRVTPRSDEACRMFCGMRAGFDGTYESLPSACTAAGRRAQRDRFLKAYRARQHAQAAQMLEQLMARCERHMGWIEVDEVRNDLALALYHLGEPARCLATLADTRAGQVKDEEALRQGEPLFLPPCDFENYIGVARATWFNRALCTKALPARR